MITTQTRPSISVALVYPNVFRVGMGNLGFQFVYSRLNAHPLFSAERFFVSDASDRKGRSDRGPLSKESGRTLRDFQAIAFSVPFENDYPAIPGALLAAGIPSLQADRGPDDPLVIAGGVSVSMNPEPLAPFLDMAYIGELDDESTEPALFSMLAQAFEESGTNRDRAQVLARFRDVPGAYVPSAYRFDHDATGLIRGIEVAPGFPSRVTAVKRRSAKASVPVSVLFSPEAEFGESLLIETNRGCARGCRFCASGWMHQPVRHVEFNRFRNDVDSAIRDGRTVGLIGSDLAGHPDLEEILTYITDRGGRFSLSSIRPEGLSSSIIELIARTGQKTATLAPETASPEMKRIIGKNIPSERFYELVERLVAAGIPNIRFYFMVGFPAETDNDAQAIVEFCLESRRLFVDASRPQKKIGKIAVQLNPFVPKPWTPFQWAAMASEKVLRKRIKIVREGLRKVPNLVVRAESVREATAQGVLSRGDRRLAALLLRVAEQHGRWSGIFRSNPDLPEFYAHRERSQHEIFPWDVVDHGVSKDTLRKVFVKSMGTGLVREVLGKHTDNE